MLDLTVSNFVHRHSLSGLERLLKRLNEGAKLRELCDEFSYPRSSMARIIQTITKKEFVLKQGALDFLNYKAEHHKWIAEQHEKVVSKIISKNAELKHITGGLHAIAQTTRAQEHVR